MRQFAFVAGLLVVAGLVLSGCSSKNNDPFAGVASPLYPGKGPLPKGGGRYHVGKPYQVAGRWFKPAENPRYDKVGLASWYGSQYHRRRTSNGEWFDMNYLSAAHATLPLPSYAKVTNLQNRREVIVRVNDRGPFVGTRIIDLSRRSAEALGFKSQGTAKVRVQYIGPAPINDKGTHLMAMNRELEQGTPLRQMIAAANGESWRPEPVIASQPIESNDYGVAAQPQVAQAQPQQQLGAADSGYFVQVGSFADEGNAERTRAQLSGIGPVEVLPLSGSTGTLFRVRVGPLDDESAAQGVLQMVVDSGHSDARLIFAHKML